jgi:hypothetical protein
MIVFRKEQLDSLSRNQENRFVDRLVAFLQEQFPDAAAEPVHELRPGVEDQTRKAAKYGLELEQEQAVYVTSAWLLGADFDAHFPAAQHMLESPDYTPEQKSDWLEAWTVKMFEELEKE